MDSKKKAELFAKQRSLIDAGNRFLGEGDIFNACHRYVDAYFINKELDKSPFIADLKSKILEHQREIDYLEIHIKNRKKFMTLSDNALKRAADWEQNQKNPKKIIKEYRKAIEAFKKVGMFDEALDAIDKLVTHRKKL